ncbi:MAG: hypothetical protein PHE03_10740 [Bacteroidales bacterium]|nr:hypothetical protein [Bacteroidales bacterium]MDD3892764.1 hypothetical protein [Bacteroidales bacterium]
MKIKSLKYLALAILGGALMFTSCEKDPEVFDEPTITISEGNSVDLNITEGPTYALELNVTIAAPGKIEKISIERSKLLDGVLVGEVLSTENQNFFELTEAAFKHEDNVNYEDFINGTIDKVEYVFVVKDRQGGINSASFTVTMGAYETLSTEVETGEIWKIQSGLGKGSWNLKDDIGVTSLGEEEIDNRYMINANGVSTHGETETNFDGSWSSDEVEWNSGSASDQVTKGNGTKYVKANTYNYDTAIKEVALSIFNASEEANTEVVAPAVDDIYIGVHGEEVYVIKITEIDEEAVATEKANSGVMRFTYKK